MNLKSLILLASIGSTVAVNAMDKPAMNTRSKSKEKQIPEKILAIRVAVNAMDKPAMNTRSKSKEQISEKKEQEKNRQFTQSQPQNNLQANTIAQVKKSKQDDTILKFEDYYAPKPGKEKESSDDSDDDFYVYDASGLTDFNQPMDYDSDWDEALKPVHLSPEKYDDFSDNNEEAEDLKNEAFEKYPSIAPEVKNYPAEGSSNITIRKKQNNFFTPINNSPVKTNANNSPK